MKEILIINGVAGCGKDTFVKCLSEHFKVIHDSIVNPIKNIATQVGWNGVKTEKDRKLLADVLDLFDTYNDFPYEMMAKKMRDFREGKLDCDFLCIDMRDKKHILRAKKEFGALAVYVSRSSATPITSNRADAGVEDTLKYIKYDFIIENNGDIDELRKTTFIFLVNVAMRETKMVSRNLNGQSTRSTPKVYDRVVYVSHPYNGDATNLQKIEEIIKILVKRFPNILFVSPTHAFGFEYNFLDYARGLNQCLWLLDKCDEVWVFGDYSTSRGCMAEIEYAKQKCKKIRLSKERA